MKHFLYVILTSVLLLTTTGCGLVAFPQKQTPENGGNQTNTSITAQNEVSTSEKQKDRPTSSVKKPGEKPLFDQVQESIVMTKDDKKEAPVPPTAMLPLEPGKTVNPPRENSPVLPEPTNGEVRSGDGEESPSNDKYTLAKQKADELNNTEQTVTADQGNVYEHPGEKSTVLQQVIKDQKLFVNKTRVDKNDAEIWCSISGNDGQKDINGWVSYQVIEK